MFTKRFNYFPSYPGEEILEIPMHEDKCFSNIITPVNTENLHRWLIRSDYDKQETKFLIEGFTHGFELGYEGPHNRISTARNLPLSVGTKADIWRKLMKEVKLGRPFQTRFAICELHPIPNWIGP